MRKSLDFFAVSINLSPENNSFKLCSIFSWQGILLIYCFHWRKSSLKEKMVGSFVSTVLPSLFSFLLHFHCLLSPRPSQNRNNIYRKSGCPWKNPTVYIYIYTFKGIKCLPGRSCTNKSYSNIFPNKHVPNSESYFAKKGYPEKIHK